MGGRTFEDLVEVMRRLRRDCPWDREQSHATLRAYVLEEAYEVVDAIERGGGQKLADEAGDLLFQVVFIAQVASETGTFDVGDVIQRIHDKLVRRHPHVFGEVEVSGAAEVVRNWEAIKAQERAADAGSAPPSALDDVPRALPALVRARKLGNRAARAGFDWRAAGDVVAKLREETAEIESAMSAGDREAAGRELGDLLFAAAQLSRFLEADPEDAAREAASRFEARFRDMEAACREEGRKLSDLDDDALDVLWRRAKERLGGTSPGDTPTGQAPPTAKH